MKPKHVVLLLLSVLFAGAACSEEFEKLSDPKDYVIFGDFYGECIGEGCVDFYRIANKEVFEDTLDRYPIASKLPHQVQWVPLDGSRYEELANLVGEIPAELFDETAVVIGQPDAGDWGGFYLETNISGETRYWLIDKMEENLPEYLRSYVKKLDEAISLMG